MTAAEIKAMSRDELRAEYDELTLRIQSIDMQLGERKPIGYVSDIDWKAYRVWKSSALAARLSLTRDKNRVKTAMRSIADAVDQDDVRDMSNAIIDALGLNGDGDKCGTVLSTVRAVLERWEDESC